MEKKFTKGPWKAEILDDPFDPEGQFSVDVKGVSDPHKYEWVASVHRQFKGKENGEANARLIAAAPEMFELLEEFISIYNNGGWGLETLLHFQAQELITRITKQP